MGGGRCLLTGSYDTEEHDRRVMGLCEAVLTKPWERADIHAAVARALAMRAKSE